MTETERTSEAATFAAAFDAGWRRGREGFFDHFLALADADVLLTQPLLPSARGHEGFRTLFAPLFEAMPDLRGELVGWTPAPDGLTIELALHGTLDGVPVAFVTRDRIVLRDGRMLERHARFNPLPLLVGLARRPRTAVRLLRATRPRRSRG